LDWTDLVYTSDTIEIEKYKLEYNDVLFNRTNSPELVGKTAIYKSEQPAIYAGYLIRVQCLPD
ncbi:restriction endonuclease subunit S, partial [Escherichia coli]|nr:restriction endonuclease subunit S [Escherichia coli]